MCYQEIPYCFLHLNTPIQFNRIGLNKNNQKISKRLKKTKIIIPHKR